MIPFLVRVLNGLIDLHEQVESLAGGQPLPVHSSVRDRLTVDVVHGKVGLALWRGADIEDLGDVGMVHHRQRLALGLEPRHDLGRAIRALITFRATRRRIGWGCSASQTSPIPPAPTGRMRR